jgi:hypothetical protein
VDALRAAQQDGGLIDARQFAEAPECHFGVNARSRLSMLWRRLALARDSGCCAAGGHCQCGESDQQQASVRCPRSRPGDQSLQCRRVAVLHLRNGFDSAGNTRVGAGATVIRDAVPADLVASPAVDERRG